MVNQDVELPIGDTKNIDILYHASPSHNRHAISRLGIRGANREGWKIMGKNFLPVVWLSPYPNTAIHMASASEEMATRVELPDIDLYEVDMRGLTVYEAGFFIGSLYPHAPLSAEMIYVGDLPTSRISLIRTDEKRDIHLLDILSTKEWWP